MTGRLEFASNNYQLEYFRVRTNFRAKESALKTPGNYYSGKNSAPKVSGIWMRILDSGRVETYCEVRLQDGKLCKNFPGRRLARDVGTQELYAYRPTVSLRNKQPQH